MYRDQHARLRSVMLFSLLSGLSPPVQYHIPHRPFHFPCASDLACGSNLEPRATFTVSVCGIPQLRMSRSTCVFHGTVQEGFTVTPEVSCGPTRGPEASCIKKHVNSPPAGFLMTALIVHITSVRGNKSKLIPAEPCLELVMSLSISLFSHFSSHSSLFISVSLHLRLLFSLSSSLLFFFGRCVVSIEIDTYIDLHIHTHINTYTYIHIHLRIHIEIQKNHRCTDIETKRKDTRERQER